MVLLHSWLRRLVILAAAAALVGYGRPRGHAGFDESAGRLGSLYAAAIGVQLIVGVVAVVLSPVVVVLAIPTGAWPL